jgi:hypothetical protein
MDGRMLGYDTRDLIEVRRITTFKHERERVEATKSTRDE